VRPVASGPPSIPRAPVASRRLARLATAALLLVAADPGPAAGADLIPLTVDHARSFVLAIADRAGLLRFLGHRHAILASEWSAEIAVAPDDLSRGRVHIRIPTTGLRIDTPTAIRLAGLGTGPDEETVRELQTKMLGPQFLDATRYPSIEFLGEAIGAVGGDRIRVRGPVRLRGREEPVTVDLAVRRDGSEYRFSGEFQIRQTAHGIQPESIAGVVKVADPVAIRIDVVARQR
jgi:polyisoprenoid-binding protein YceI